MSVVVNSLRSTESKSDESGLSFLEVLDSNSECSDFSIDREEESNVNEELAGIMSSMLNSNLPKVDEDIDISVIQDGVEDKLHSLMITELREPLGLDISSNVDELITTFNEMKEKNILEQVNTLNVDNNLSDLKTNKVVESDTLNMHQLRAFIETVDSDSLISVDSLARLFNSKETMNTVDSHIKGKEKISEILNSSPDKGHVFEIESKISAISNKETLDLDNSNLFQFSGFKNRDIVSDEGVTQHNDDISILNNIAFSSNDFNKSIKGTEALVVREQSIGRDILQAVKYLNNNNVEELTLKMNPKDLGEINIKYLRYEGIDRVIITLSKEDTFGMVNGNIDEIKNHLINLDIGIEDVSVEVRHNNADDFSDNFNQQFNKNSSKEEKRNRLAREELDGETNLTLEDTNINFLI